MTEGGGYKKTDSRVSAMHLRQNEAYEEGFSRAMHEHRPEIQRAVEHIRESIDWNILIPILTKYLHDAGVPEEQFNLAPITGEMPVRPSKEYVAVYIPNYNKVGFSSFNSDFMAGVRLLQKNGSIPRLLLMKMQLTLIHEICHALSENRLASRDISASQTVTNARSGFSQSFMAQDIDNRHRAQKKKKVQHPVLNFHEALNEAVTQRLAEEIMVTYSRAADTTHGEHFVASFVERSGKHLWKYSIFANHLHTMCVKIAEHHNKKPEDIWLNFKRAYFKNPSQFIEETRIVLEEIYGVDFWREYQTMGNHTELKMIGAFDSINKFPHPRTYPEHWLAQLGIAKNK